MPGLLDYVIKGYTHGGSVDFDPYADISQAQLLERFGIHVDTSALGLLPTYDTTGADLYRDAYGLRGQATRGQATGGLLDLTQQTQQQQAGSRFKELGAGQQAYRDVRGDVVTEYGQVAHEQYLDLQTDISGFQQDYESELLAAISDLPATSWSFTGDDDDDENDFEGNESCFRDCDEMHFPGGQRDACYDACSGDGGTTPLSCADQGLSECTDPNAMNTGECEACEYGGGDPLGVPFAPQFGCFLSDTMISLADGSSIPIGDIEKDMLVVTYDNKSKEIKTSKVNKVFFHPEQDGYLIINNVLSVTPNHIVLSDGEWVEIGSLKVGDTLTDREQSPVKIEKIEIVGDKVDVYNFEVDKYHTYIAEGLIVHNIKEYFAGEFD